MAITFLILTIVLSLDYLIFLTYSSTKYITKLIIIGVTSRVLFILFTFIFGISFQINYLVSLSIGIVALVIYSQAIVKSLQRQSEVISRFFLDAMPAQQVNIELDQRAGFISSASAREAKKNLFNSSVSIGSFEGLVRWLIIDIWLMGLGSMLVGVLSYLRISNILESIQEASATLFLLSLSSIISALPLVKYLSFLNINQKEELLDKKKISLRLLILNVVILCFSLLILGFTSSLPIVASATIFSLFFLYHSRKKSSTAFVYKRSEEGDFQHCNYVDRDLDFINISVPVNLLNALNEHEVKSILNSSDLKDGISSFIKGIIFIETKPVYQKITRIFSEKKILKTLFLSDYSYDRVREDFGLEISNIKLPDTIRNKLNIETGLSSYLHDFFIRAETSRLAATNYLINLEQKYAGLNISISLLKKNSYDSYLDAVKIVDKLGYKNITEQAMIEMIIKYSSLDFEPNEFAEELIKILVEEDPKLLSSNDGSAHMIYLSEEALSDELTLKQNISEIAIRLKKRGISKLVVKVPQLSDKRVSSIMDYLKDFNMRGCVLDSSIRPRISVFPVLVI